MTIDRKDIRPGRRVYISIAKEEDGPVKRLTATVVSLKPESDICLVKGVFGKDTIIDIPMGRAQAILRPKNKKVNIPQSL